MAIWDSRTPPLPWRVTWGVDGHLSSDDKNAGFIPPIPDLYRQSHSYESYQCSCGSMICVWLLNYSLRGLPTLFSIMPVWKRPVWCASHATGWFLRHRR